MHPLGTKSEHTTMTTTFKIEYHTKWGESLSLVLNDIKYPMSWNEGGIWSVSVKNCTASALKNYTYIVLKDGLIDRAEWSHHSSTPAEEIVDSWIDCPIAGCPFPRAHQAECFDIPGWKGAGVAVPVFSLRSERDFGIGEFADLRLLVDWAAAVGMSVVQLLPVNDTTRKGEWKDSYPYNPISSFALHPLYINLQALGIKEDKAFLKEQKDLNELPELDYPRVFKSKMSYIRKAFLDNGAKDMASSAYKRFVKENLSWLDEYARFCAQRDSLEAEYYCWMQYHLDRQFTAEVEYARCKGVHFKGDLPIGVSADSAEAYFHPELFNLDSTAGAPPDYFSTDGQNWGFPTYNWEKMAEDDYAWWKSRLRKMAHYFDAYRIDHILGFFRIWEIPLEYKSGLNGHFNPALPYSEAEIRDLGIPIEGLFHADPRNPGKYQPLISPKSQDLPGWQQERFGALYNDFFYHRNDQFWRVNALRKLPELLGASGMLACGEDLGMVPDCVPGVMESQKILSLRMRGMDCKGGWKYLSVCATSSHDMETLRMQCPNDPDPSDVGGMLWEYLSSPSMLAIFPLQDFLALDGEHRRANRDEERINYPADSNHHWRYRIHFNLEKLSEFDSMNRIVATMIKDSGR